MICFRVLTSLLFALLVTGCGIAPPSPPKSYPVDQILIRQFAPEAELTQEETGVYVIRDWAFTGSARGVWLAVNDRVIASVTNNSHIYFTIQSGVNSVHLVQETIGFGYVPVDGRPGETLFLVVDYNSATLREVPSDQGMTLVADTNRREKLAVPRPNDARDDAVLNPGNFGLQLTLPSDEPMEPQSDTALVTFIRPSNLAADAPFSIWNQDGFVAQLFGRQAVDVRLPPGMHTLIARAERYAVLTGTFEAGEQYAVELGVGVGWANAHLKLRPMTLEKLEKRSVKVDRHVLNKEALSDEMVSKRLEEGHAYLDDIRSQIAAGEVPLRTMDGRVID